MTLPPAASAASRMRAIVQHIACSGNADRVSSAEATELQEPNEPLALNSATRWNGWGFADTGLFVNDDGVIEISGSRYPDLFEHSGARTLPSLLPWAEGAIGLSLARKSHATIRDVSDLQIQPREYGENETAVLKALELFLHKLQCEGGIRASTTLEERVRHSHGQTCEDVFRLRHETKIERIPDAVVWPKSHNQVEFLVHAAVEMSDLICLIPHGGGTKYVAACRRFWWTNALELTALLCLQRLERTRMQSSRDTSDRVHRSARDEEDLARGQGEHADSCGNRHHWR